MSYRTTTYEIVVLRLACSFPVSALFSAEKRGEEVGNFPFGRTSLDLLGRPERFRESYGPQDRLRSTIVGP